MDIPIPRGETARLEGGIRVISLTDDCVRVDGFGWFVELTLNRANGKIEGYVEGPYPATLHLYGKEIAGECIEFEIVAERRA